jgi:hypothetical protein
MKNVHVSCVAGLDRPDQVQGQTASQEQFSKYDPSMFQAMTSLPLLLA